MVKLYESEEQSIYVPVPVSQHSSHRSESHAYPQDDDDWRHVYRWDGLVQPHLGITYYISGRPRSEIVVKTEGTIEIPVAKKSYAGAKNACRR